MTNAGLDTKPLGAGDVLAQRYRLLRALSGSVWEAEHLSLAAPVAVKLFAGMRDEPARARFLRAARAAATMRSAHLVQIIDYGVHDDTPYLVMELLHGESLAQRLARVGALDPAQTLELVAQLGRAMSKAHEAGVVQGELSTADVFMVPTDEGEIAKVLDVGIASTADATELVSIAVIAQACLAAGSQPAAFAAWFAKASARDRGFRGVDELLDALAVVLTRAPLRTATSQSSRGIVVAVGIAALAIGLAIAWIGREGPRVATPVPAEPIVAAPPPHEPAPPIAAPAPIVAAPPAVEVSDAPTRAGRDKRVQPRIKPPAPKPDAKVGGDPDELEF